MLVFTHQRVLNGFDCAAPLGLFHVLRKSIDIWEKETASEPNSRPEKDLFSLRSYKQAIMWLPTSMLKRHESKGLGHLKRAITKAWKLRQATMPEYVNGTAGFADMPKSYFALLAAFRRAGYLVVQKM